MHHVRIWFIPCILLHCPLYLLACYPRHLGLTTPGARSNLPLRVCFQLVEHRSLSHQCRENKNSKICMYLGRLNLGEFHLIVVIISTISTGLDVFPPVLVVSVAGEREDAGLERAEDGEGDVGEGGGGRPGGEEEEESVEVPGYDLGVRGPPHRGQRARVVVPSASGGERERAGGRRGQGAVPR